MRLSWRFCGHDECVPTRVPGWHVCAFMQMDFAGNCLFCHRTRDTFRWPGGHIDGQEVQNAYMTGQWYGHVERIPGLPASRCRTRGGRGTTLGEGHVPQTP